MKHIRWTVVCGLALLFPHVAARAIDLKQSKFTQVVNDVQVFSASDETHKAAEVAELFSVPDVIRTGPASRAELVADDETITRVGANTVFSFDKANRTIDLEKGSILFHPPHGKGGGTVRYGTASATVLGTTIICSVTSDGGFKVLVLEGVCEVRFGDDKHERLTAGRMIFIPHDKNQAAPVVAFRLDEQTRGSKLITGFDHPLDSMPLINAEIDKQIVMIQKGRAEDTTLVVGNSGLASTVSVGDGTVQASVGAGAISTGVGAKVGVSSGGVSAGASTTVAAGGVAVDAGVSVAANTGGTTAVSGSTGISAGSVNVGASVGVSAGAGSGVNLGTSVGVGAGPVNVNVGAGVSVGSGGVNASVGVGGVGTSVGGALGTVGGAVGGTVGTVGGVVGGTVGTIGGAVGGLVGGLGKL